MRRLTFPDPIRETIPGFCCRCCCFILWNLLSYSCQNVFSEEQEINVNQRLILDRSVIHTFHWTSHCATVRVFSPYVTLTVQSRVVILWLHGDHLSYLEWSIWTFQQVLDENPDIRKRLTSDDPDLTSNERLIIGQFLEAYADVEWSECTVY